MTTKKEKEIILSMMNEADAEEMLEEEDETLEDAEATVFEED